MRLEDEIKQPKFKNEYQKATLNIMYTSSWLNGMSQKFFKSYNLSQKQYNILRILRGQYPEPATVNLLIDRMLDKMSNASRLVDKLIIKKLVKKTENPEDRRRANVIITKKGLKLLEEMDEQIDSFQDNLKSITKEEAKILNNILDKLRG